MFLSFDCVAEVAAFSQTLLQRYSHERVTNEKYDETNYTRPTMRIKQNDLPNEIFHSCCGRIIFLKRKDSLSCLSIVRKGLIWSSATAFLVLAKPTRQNGVCFFLLFNLFLFFQKHTHKKTQLKTSKDALGKRS